MFLCMKKIQKKKLTHICRNNLEHNCATVAGDGGVPTTTYEFLDILFIFRNLLNCRLNCRY